MGKTTAVNADDGLYSTLLDLKRHLASCRDCRMAIRASWPEGMCINGMRLTLSVATRYDKVIDLRITARRSGERYVIPCPDAGKHGKSYAITATPVLVAGEQTALF